MEVQDHVINFNKICRLCLAEESVMSSIYNETDKHSSTVPLPLRIMACVSIELNSIDGLPSQICTTCLYQVDGWYKFKDLCETADALLKKCARNEPIQFETISQIRSKAKEVRQSFASSHYIKVESLDSGLNHPKTATKPLVSKGKGVRKKKEAEVEANEREKEGPLQKGEGGVLWGSSEMRTDGTEEQRTEGDFEEVGKKRKRKLNYADVTYDHPVPTKDGKVHQCRICQKYLKNVTTRNRHELEKHPPPLPCEFCQKTFTTVLTYHTHRNIHLGLTKFRCSFCGKHLASRLHLEDHEKVHTKERPVQCPQCDKTFSSASNLRVHLKFHAGIKTHFCHICGKGHVTIGNLKLHVKRHSNERSHVCHICGKGFNGKSELKKHIESHDTEKKYSCQYCLQKLKTPNSLRRHINIQHLKLRPYKCDLCLRAFGRRENLNEHMQLHTPNKNFSCQTCATQFTNFKYLTTHKCKKPLGTALADPPPCNQAPSFTKSSASAQALSQTGFK